jgi:peroxiredoxin
MDSFLVGAQFLLAGVFALAGTAKLFDLTASRRAVVDFGVPQSAGHLVGTLLPLAELAIALSLIFHPTARWGALAALVLLLAFVGGIANALRQGKDVDCGCFGPVYSATASTLTLIRNAALAALAFVVVLEGPAPAIDDWVGARSAAELVAIAMAIALVALAALAWILWSKTRTLQRMLDEAPERKPDPQGLPLGALAPRFALPDKHGEIHTLESSLAEGRRVVLTFMDAGCGPCKTVGHKLARWQSALADRLRIVVVSAGTAQQAQGVWDEYGIDVLFDPNDELSRAFLVKSTPTALIVEPDGRVGSTPSAGVHGVEVLVRLALRSPEPAERVEIGAARLPQVLTVDPGTP